MKISYTDHFDVTLQSLFRRIQLTPGVCNHRVMTPVTQFAPRVLIRALLHALLFHSLFLVIQKCHSDL